MQVDLCDLEAKLVYNQDNQGDTVKTLSEWMKWMNEISQSNRKE